MVGYASNPRSYWPIVGFALCVLGLGGGFLGLVVAGIIELPFLKAREPSRVGMVQVVMSGVPIPAYTQLNRDHLINPQTKQAATFWLANEQVPPGVKIELSEVAGRVLKRDKPAGYFFTEDDFLPRGTRPGLVAGVPAGKRSITLDATKVMGVAGLKVGDRFDIIASIAFDERPSGRTIGVPGYASSLGEKQKRARVKVVVENGEVVLPVYLRAVPSTSHSLTSGSQTSAKPVQELVIAVDPREVPRLAEALAVAADLTAVARSGLPDDKLRASSVVVDEAADVDAPAPRPQFKVIETIVGKKRTQVEVPLSLSQPNSAGTHSWLKVLAGILERRTGDAVATNLDQDPK